MNDIDFAAELRTALHRDAALVGEPSSDLLDQLGRRWQAQRRQRLALSGAVAAVVLVAAGIPIGVSLAANPAPAPATQQLELTPSVSPTVSAAPSPAVAPSTTATSDSADASRTSQAPPTCPSAAGFRAVLLAHTGGAPDTVVVNPAAPEPQCAGIWGVIDLDRVGTDGNGTVHETTFIQLFRYVDGAWTAVDRWQYCAAGQVPAAIERFTCESD